MSEVGQRIIQAIRDIAAESPGFVYVRPADKVKCVYVAGGEPSCIVGKALWRLGFIDAALEDVDPEKGWMMPNMMPASDLIQRVLHLDIDIEEAEWISEVQYHQDGAKPWGEAVQFADRYVERRVQ